MAIKKIELPSVLAFERKLEVSDALMYAGVWGDDDTPNTTQEWKKIEITKRISRATQSAYGTEVKKRSQPNIATTEDANLSTGNNTLKVAFTLRIIGLLGKPFTCNDPNFEKAIIDKVRKFEGEDGRGLETLAYRYAYNLANGRFLWRNRVCAEKIHIDVQPNHQDALSFDANHFSLRDFDKNANDEALKQLTAIFKQGLHSNDDFVFLSVNAYVKLGDNQHVFPSQEMNIDEKEKVLFKLGDCAAIHDVKIGNALRTVDNWYEEDAEFPIAAEPFGAVTHRGIAYRGNKNNLYTLMVNWVNNKELGDNDKNYVISNLIRGGVFSNSKKGK